LLDTSPDSVTIDVGTLPVNRMGAARWYWEETEGHMVHHDPANVIDQHWVRYDAAVEAQLEHLKHSAIPGQLQTVTIQQGGNSFEYDLDLLADPMLQTKRATGFQRKVRRLAADQGVASAVDSSVVQRSRSGLIPPPELVDETHLVLPKAALIQISKQGADVGLHDWAYGNVMYSPEDADPAFAALVTDPDSNLSLDGGWFPLSITTVPTQDDLSKLSGLMGGADAAGCLAQPASWSAMQDSGHAECFTLLDGAAERVQVENAFKATLPSNVQVIGVDRVQNLAMWQSYAVKRQTILARDKDDPPASLERLWLFHGTNIEVADKIVQQGFNRSFCGKNATLYGKGVYFARDASYSSSTGYSVPDSKGVQHMFACRVTIGQCCRGKKDALTPDIRKGHTLYDTTTDDPGSNNNPAIYVTYHDSQAYPEYLIHFRQP